MLQTATIKNTLQQISLKSTVLEAAVYNTIYNLDTVIWLDPEVKYSLKSSDNSTIITVVNQAWHSILKANGEQTDYIRIH